ncbi:hypothetical protein Acr_00g0015350 [Actinidia rufa]|uniref:Uncharacterized protein n=1 Tax=Actinidia rufa TaxID=165716 RepID=A0A7J0DCB7_9ERIC|nr:hypothetical protein Acr_00g0015350 [Actinidia rufa]
MEEPLNLNYILLKKMADVRNHNTRSLPFGAFLTRVFLHFKINLNNQPSVDIDKGFSKGTVKKAKNLGLEEVQREEDRMDMDTEGNVAIGLIEGATDTGYEMDPVNLGQDQNMGYGTDTLDDDVHRFFSTRTTYSTHKEYPHKRNRLLKRIRYIKEDENLFVEQGSKIDKIGNNCETMQATNGEYAHTFSEIQDQLVGIWHTIDPLPYISFNPENVPPPSQPYYRYPPY